jgi:N-acylneuraminate cytidylyltransferase
MNTLKCIEKSAILTDITGSIIISEMEAQDIDTEMDWKLAELKYELLQSLK